MKKCGLLFLFCGLLAMILAGCGEKVSEKELQELGFEEDEKLLAFPGADGWGKYAKGGRGGKVIRVTNLNDSGEGSLRAAVEAKGPRTVVFDVSGTIELEDFLVIKEPYITIAGQTAPGGGICLKNYALIVETEEAMVRYLHCRPGDTGGDTDALWVNEADQVVIDHVSASWGTDETLSVSDSDHVSVQWCIISESLNHSVHSKGTHGMGSLIRGSGGQRVTYHSNLFSSHRNRSPMCGNYTPITEDPEGLQFEFINNVVYNWGAKAAGKCHDVDSLSHYNFIGNYYLPGPRSGGTYMFSEGCANNKMYAAGNAMEGVVPEDQRSLFEVEDNMENFEYDSYLQEEPFESEMANILSAEEAFPKVMEGAGASLVRDHVDEAVVDAVKAGEGSLIDKVEQSVGWEGSYPKLAQTESPEDTDGDGIPDEWEKAHGLDPEKSGDGAEESRYGYTYLEIYLQSLVASK